MRKAAFGLAVLLLDSGTLAAAPTYSCFDPPDEGQTNGLGEGMEEIVEAECCDALTDESDYLANRLVKWDPVNCNHGPGDFPITEEPLCRAHDTDGCRFCHLNCTGVEGICISCVDTTPPTPVPVTPGVTLPTPVPVMPGVTAPTSAPVTPGTPTEQPTVIAGCPSCEMEEADSSVLQVLGKYVLCDTTCTTGDPIWSTINCNMFNLGQNCRACSPYCGEDVTTGLWIDHNGLRCKPCDAISEP